MGRTLAQLARVPVTELKGVGPDKAKSLERLGMTTVLDVLTHYPLRYIDRTRQARIGDLQVGEEATVLVEVMRTSSRRPRGGRVRSMVTATVRDATDRLQLTFFNQPWREKQLRSGVPILVFGKLELFRGQRQMSNPVVDLVGDRTGKIVPIYPQSDKERLYTWEFGRWAEEVLERAGEFEEPFPAEVLDRFDFVDRHAAFHGIHAPETSDEKDEARRRLVFDELARIQLALVMRKRMLERTAKGIRHIVDGDLVPRFHRLLPFDLTPDQLRVIAEIEADLARPHPMHRLLQGEVGSGKTVVALSALLTAVQGGHQGAFMAPTEVLAEQHDLTVRSFLSGLTLPDPENLLGERPVRVALLTNRTTATERRRILGDLAAGGVDILVGTHALIQEGIEFRSLGVVVIDEQHRFGVEQRAALREKGARGEVPDVLVMTATPIPRTAAMTVYGDLDMSVIRKLPDERTREEVTTIWEHTASDDFALGELKVWAHVREQVAAARQAYVVCPLIEESDKIEARSAEETFAALAHGALAGLRLALIHGRMRSAEKEEVMNRFRAGGIDVLVATTVIEVGVDVPNATVMVVLDADRFGIAQLHQLRGRIGRADRSWCYLVGAGATPDAERRLEALVSTHDGFDLAEVDLEIRGEGTIMGERQKGRSDLKLASLRRDREWVEKARDIAFELIDADPALAGHPELADELELFMSDEDREFLFKS